MGNVTVLGHALKIVNKGGGRPTKTVKERWVEFDAKGTPVHYRKVTRMVADKHQPGSDYVVFNCPVCDKRNRACVYNAKEASGDGRLVFRCNGCRNEVAVQRPIGDLEQDKSPVLLGPDGEPARK